MLAFKRREAEMEWLGLHGLFLPTQRRETGLLDRRPLRYRRQDHASSEAIHRAATGSRHRLPYTQPEEGRNADSHRDYEPGLHQPTPGDDNIIL